MTAPAPAPAPDEPVVEVGLNKEEVRQVIKDHLIPIRHCYESELKKNEDLNGKLVLEWEIGDLGKVEVVRIKQGFNAAVDECVAGVIKSALFPSPPKNQIGRVVYPFVFSSR